MTKEMHIWVKEKIETTAGLTQRGLAEALSVNPSAINRMIHGQRKIKVDEIPTIETYLGERYSSDAQPEPFVIGASDREHAALSAAGISTTGYTDQNAAIADFVIQNGFNQVPVYGVTKSETGIATLTTDDAIDWVVRHPFQNGIDDAFALYVFDDTMEPRYFMNELVYLHPGRPPEIGKDCLIVLDDDYVMLAQFLGEDRHQIEFKCYNRKKKFAFPRGRIQSLYSVLGRG